MKRIGVLSKVFILLLSGILGTSALGATITLQELGEGSQRATFIFVEGEINLGDEKIFADYALKTDSAIVAFNSPGGNVLAGIEMGKAIRLKSFSTLATGGFKCASACALAWLGGQTRFMGSDSSIGFHAVFRIGGHVDAVGNAVVGAYLNQLGLPFAAVAYISEAQPNDMRWLTFQDAAKIGIEVKLLSLPVNSTEDSESPQNDRDDKVAGREEWIQIYSRPDRNSATLLARQKQVRHPNTRVFKYDNGWFVVVLGPYQSGAAESAKTGLVAAKEIPPDSFIIGGARFLGSVVTDDSVLDQMAAIRATNELFRVWSLPNALALKAIASYYPPEVEYYGKKILASEVMREKVAFVERWPSRSYRVREGDLTSICNSAGVCAVEGIVDWEAQSPARRAKSDGAAKFRYVFVHRGSIKLISEWTEVLSRTVSKGR